MRQSNKQGQNKKAQQRLFSRMAFSALVPAVLLAQAATAQSAGKNGEPALAQAEIGSLGAMRDFNIPALPLPEAIQLFSHQSGLQIAYRSEDLRDRQAAAVQGRQTPAQALQALLRGTGIGYRQTGNTTLALTPGAAGQHPAGSTGQVRLSTVTVPGEVPLTAADPVPGYIASRTSGGTRTDAAIHDVPQAIQVVSRPLIEDRQANRMGDVVNVVSSVRPGATSGNRTEEILLRGFSTSYAATDGRANSPIWGDGLFADMANVERVEVLKGPASALYGSSDPGGILNIITKQPQAEAGYGATASIGSFGFQRLEGDATGAVTADKALLYRMVAAHQEGGSFRDFFIDGQRTFAAPTLQWQGSATKLTLYSQFNDQRQQFDRGLIASGGKVADIPIERYTGERFSIYDATQWRLGLGLEHELNDTWSLRSHARTVRGDAIRFSADPTGLQGDGRTLNRRVTDQSDEFEHNSVQTDLVGHDLKIGGLSHTLLAGFEVSYAKRATALRFLNLNTLDIYNPAYGAEPGTQNGAARLTIDEMNVMAGYVQDEIELSEYWKLLLGGRYEHAQIDTTRSNAANVNLSATALTPRIGLVFQPLPALSLYASYVESFRAQPSAGLSVSGTPFDPETGQQYEAGVKYENADKTLTANLAAYQVTRQNVATNDPANPGFSIVTGEQRSRGVELDITTQPIPGLRLIASAAYTNAVVTKDNTVAVGNRLAAIPAWSGSLWATYELQDEAWRGLGFGAGLIAADQRAGDLANTFVLPGYLRLDAALYYRFNDNIKVSLVGRNLFDTRYYETSSSRTEIHAGAPFTVIGALAVTF